MHKEQEDPPENEVKHLKGVFMSKKFKSNLELHSDESQVHGGI